MGALQLIDNQELRISSRDVAEMMDLRHSDLIRKMVNIEEVLTNAKVRSLEYWIESTYKDAKGEERKEYLVSKKGCELLAHKSTGEKGILFTVKYMEKFEAMEKALNLRKDSFMIEDPIERAKVWIEEQEEKLMLEQKIAEYEPKITYLDEILNSNDAITVTQIAADYAISAIKLNKILAEEEVQYKVSGQWILKIKYKDKGYTKSNTFIDGSGKARIITKWTQKGRLFIHNLLEKNGIKAVMDYE